MREKNVTFADIAKYTGFSKTTISRYFNNPDSITIENQQKIADALKVLNYKENKVAKILANGSTEFIGIIIPNLYMHYYSDILNKLISTYEKYGYKFIVFAGHDQLEVERKYIQELLAYKIEGLIVLSHTIPSKELASYNVPIVSIEREDEYICSVNTDNYMGAIQATSLLVKSGSDVVIHVNSNVAPNIPAYGRILGFKEFCQSHNLENRLIITDFGKDLEETHQIILELFNSFENDYPNQTLGIFMPNDTYANILLNLIVNKYGKLPDRYNIVGFDNSIISREAVIPISTVGQQIDVITQETMELLRLQITALKKRVPTPITEPIHKTVTPVLVRRKTSI